MRKTLTNLLESFVTGCLIILVNLLMSFIVYLLFLYTILPLLCDFVPAIQAFFERSIAQNAVAVYSIINGVCCFIALIPTYILVYRFHIKRNKKFIRDTAGRIAPKDALRYHAQNYIVTEIGTATVVFLIAVTNALIPSSPFQMAFDMIFEVLGLVCGLFLALLYIVIAQWVGIDRTLNYWRAISYIGD